MVTNRYKEALDEYTNLLTGNETPDEDETFALVSSLKKVATFYNCHDLGQLDIWDGLFKSLTEARDALIEGQPPLLPDEAVKYCMLACYFGLLWYR